MSRRRSGAGVRAASSCIGLSIKLLIVLFFLGGAFMLASIFGLWGGVVPDNIAMLDFLSPAPKSFKQARKLATEGRYDAAIQKYNDFFTYDAAKASKKTVINAHLHLAQIYLELADNRGASFNYGGPDTSTRRNESGANDVTRSELRQLAREQCDRVFEISPGNPAASRIKTMIDNSEGLR